MSILIKRVKSRLHNRNQNWLCIVCGQTGSGKSYSALTLANEIDPDFNIDRVVFTVKDFMNILNAGALKRGSVIVFDEAGVEIGSREWYSLRNKTINYVLQTFRHLNLAVIFTTPSFRFVDAQTRKLFHTYIETQSINQEEKYVRVKWQDLQVNPKMNKTYYKYQRVRKGGIKKIGVVKIHKPPKELVKNYEEKRALYTNKLRNEIESLLKEKTEKNECEYSREDIIKEVLDKPDYYTKEYKNRKFIDKNLIVANFNCSKEESKVIKAKVEAELNI